MNSEYSLVITTEERDDGSEPALLGLVVDVADVTIHDVWHVCGMKGTGSHRVVTDLADRQDKATLQQAAILRMASPRICALARDAIDTMLDGAGSSVNELRSPFRRYKRDVDTLKSHSYLHWDGAAVTAGAALLGVTDNPDGLLLV